MYLVPLPLSWSQVWVQGTEGPVVQSLGGTSRRQSLGRPLGRLSVQGPGVVVGALVLVGLKPPVLLTLRLRS